MSSGSRKVNNDDIELTELALAICTVITATTQDRWFNRCLRLIKDRCKETYGESKESIYSFVKDNIGMAFKNADGKLVSSLPVNTDLKGIVFILANTSVSLEYEYDSVYCVCNNDMMLSYTYTMSPYMLSKLHKELRRHLLSYISYLIYNSIVKEASTNGKNNDKLSAEGVQDISGGPITFRKGECRFILPGTSNI